MASKETIENDFRTLKNRQGLRINWDWQWQTIADYTIPRRGDFTVQRFQGQRRDYNIYDTTALWAGDQLAAGLHQLLTSQALPWFYLAMQDPQYARMPDVQAWLDDCEQRMYAVFNDPETRFQAHLHEIYLDLGHFGTGVMYSEFDKHIRFSTRFLAECFIKQNRWGIVDSCYRVFPLTKSECIAEYGMENTPADILKEENADQQFQFLHVVEPVPQGTIWESRHYWMEKQVLLREGSYNEFPYAVPRWSTSTMEDYGRGPTMNVLGDIKMVNDMKRTFIRAAHKAVDPPLLIPDEGFMQPINTNAGATNYYDQTNPGRPEFLVSKARFPEFETLLKDTQQSIIRAFYVDMLQLPGGLMPGAQNQNTYMTATEALMRRENSMRVIGPVVARLQTELLNPIIVRTFNMLARNRSLAPPPPQIAGKGIHPIYVSPLAIAQQSASLDNFNRLMQTILPIAQIDPSVLQVIDPEETMRWAAESYHLPQRILRSRQALAAMMRARQIQQQQEQQGVQENNNLMAMKRNVMAADSLNKSFANLKVH